MTDPYKILNVSPTASDDEVKRAYRELARKYHPDNYHDNPLADLAQEKMKEINEAYETIQKQRKGSTGTSSYGYGTRQGAYGTSSDPVLQNVRIAISRGDIMMAEQLLASFSDHNAEWNYLMSVVCFRRGWLDEAKRYVDTACRMDPGNMEYQQAQRRFSGEGYRPEDYGHVTTADCGADSCSRMCYAMMCCSLLGGGSGCYFLPCFL